MRFAIATALAVLLVALLGSPAAAQTAAPPDVGAPPRRAGSSLFGWLDGGYSGQRLYGIGATAPDFSVGIGRNSRTWDVGAILDGARGKTSTGLDLTDVTVGAVISTHLGSRFRLGAGLRLGLLDFHRATGAGDLTSLSAGVFARMTFDLVPFHDDADRAVYLIAKGGADSVGPLAVVYLIPMLQGSVGLGFRF